MKRADLIKHLQKKRVARCFEKDLDKQGDEQVFDSAKTQRNQHIFGTKDLSGFGC